MKIVKVLNINKNIAIAWQVLGTEFANAHVWASSLTHSEGIGSTFNGSECNERSCDIKGMGKTREKLLQFSNENHSLSYVIEQGLPSMVKYATNTWSLTPLGQNQTKLTMKIDITTSSVMGFIMQPIMKMMMRKMSNTILADYKYYVENGRPSEAKIIALKKQM